MKLFPGHHPILHISAHGGTEGIQLSSGEILSWEHLRELLVPINESFQGALLLCMSSCEGYSACRMAMREGDGPHPYFAMVGNYGTPLWSDTAVSYLCFYHLLAKGWPIPAAVESMKMASGDDRWLAQSADEIKQGYVEYLSQRRNPDVAQKELESVAESEDLPATAKALEGL